MTRQTITLAEALQGASGADLKRVADVVGMTPAHLRNRWGTEGACPHVAGWVRELIAEELNVNIPTPTAAYD